MNEIPPIPPAPERRQDRRWFVVLAAVTLIGFALFVAAITALALRIPELKRSKFGVLQIRTGVHST
jgi:hypothetical protein